MLDINTSFAPAHNAMSFEFFGDATVTIVQTQDTQGKLHIQSSTVSEDQLYISNQEGHVIVKDTQERQAFSGNLFNKESFKFDFNANGASLGDSIRNMVHQRLSQVLGNLPASNNSFFRLNITIYLPASITHLAINGNNVHLKASDFFVNQLKIKANNLHIDQASTVYAPDLSIKSNNLHTDLVASERTKLYDISTNNGTVKIYKQHSYLGTAQISGNNAKFKGNAGGDPSQGQIMVDCNNGKLILEEVA